MAFVLFVVLKWILVAGDAVEVDQLFGQVDRDALDLGVVLDRLGALLAAQSALFEAAKRRLDQAIDSVATVGDSLDVEIENRGKAPMPVPLVVTRTDGHTDTLTVPVDVWLGGAKRTTVKLAKEPTVKSIEIDPGHDFPDVDRDNQRWPR